MKFKIGLYSIIKKSLFEFFDAIDFNSKGEGVKFILAARKLFAENLTDEKQSQKVDNAIVELLDEKYAIKIKKKS